VVIYASSRKISKKYSKKRNEKIETGDDKKKLSRFREVRD